MTSKNLPLFFMRPHRITLPCLLAIVAIVMAAFTARAADRPNILFIAVDDLRPELATYGAEVLTPNIDRLAASGLRFDRAYCQQAVCGASRLSIMGGLYPTKTSEQTYHVEGWRKRHPDLLTLNQHFRAEGYRAVGSGKIYHGSGGPGVDPDNWDEWITLKAPGYALPASEQARKDNDAAHPNNKGTSYRGPTTESAPVDDDFFIDGLRAQHAATHLGKLAADDRPFFFAVGFIKPHLPFVAPQKYWDLYEREDFSMPDNLGVPPGYPDYARNAKAGEMAKYSDYEGKSPVDFSDDLNRRLLHGYAACVSYTDANVGILLDALEASGEADNTIVVFWGDHGWKLGEHGSWCKQTNYNIDTRVPLMIRAPGIGLEGESTDRLAELVDLYPTLCELAGIDAPDGMEGTSLKPLLEDPNRQLKSAAFSQYVRRPKNSPDGKRYMGYSMVTSNYHYVEWHTWDHETKTAGELVARELYNLHTDPDENINLADLPENVETVQALAEKLEAGYEAALRVR